MKANSLRLGASFTCLLGLLSACSGEATQRPQETVATASSGLTWAGLLPYPVKSKLSATDASDAATTDPRPTVDQQLDSGGNPIPVWDGSIIDLMAADAFAQCGAGMPLPLGVNSDE